METGRHLFAMLLGVCIALLVCDHYLLNGKGRKIGVSAFVSSARSVGVER
jgi:hypothetical protein